VSVGATVSVGRNKSTVGDGSGVFVGAKVSVGLSVGGGNVFVGTAACVCATAVDAMTTTVFSRSSGLIAGAVGAAPQALASKTSRTTEPILTRRNYPLLTTILSLKLSGFHYLLGLLLYFKIRTLALAHLPCPDLSIHTSSNRPGPSHRTPPLPAPATDAVSPHHLAVD